MGEAAPLTVCLACGGGALAVFLDLGETRLANAFHAGGAALPVYPLAVARCADCGHAQLTHAVAPGLLYRHYLYVSGTTATFRRHCAALAAEASARLPAGSRVLDLACNDGTLLEAFRDLGHDVWGVDPAENLRPVTAAKGLRVRSAFWDDAAADALVREAGAFAAVTATNVLGHVADPVGFLRRCRRVLAPDGRVVVEVPDAARTFGETQFDQIYHEHLSYWTAGALRRLAARAGLGVVALHRTPIHGGSLRFTLAPAAGPAAAWTAPEDAAPDYAAFAGRVAAARAAFRLLFDLVADRRLVVGYGASAKANTALAVFGRAPAWFVDDNPAKHGWLTPGDRAIYPPERVREADVVLVTAWNFFSEIRERVRALRGGPTAYLLYVPEPRIVVG